MQFTELAFSSHFLQKRHQWGSGEKLHYLSIQCYIFFCFEFNPLTNVCLIIYSLIIQRTISHNVIEFKKVEAISETFCKTVLETMFLNTRKMKHCQTSPDKINPNQWLKKYFSAFSRTKVVKVNLMDYVIASRKYKPIGLTEKKHYPF